MPPTPSKAAKAQPSAVGSNRFEPMAFNLRVHELADLANLAEGMETHLVMFEMCKPSDPDVAVAARQTLKALEVCREEIRRLLSAAAGASKREKESKAAAARL